MAKKIRIGEWQYRMKQVGIDPDSEEPIVSLESRLMFLCLPIGGWDAHLPVMSKSIIDEFIRRKIKRYERLKKNILLDFNI